MKMIPEFNGRYKDYPRFLQLCKIQFSKAITPADRVEFLDVVRSKLCEKAYNTIRIEDYHNWEELKKDLNKHFLKYRSAQLIQSDLFTIKQGPRETVSEYARKIEALLEELNLSSTQNLDQAGVRTIKNLNEITALANFKRGLKPPLKLIVKSTKHSSLSDAVDFACEEEQALESDVRTNETKRCGFCKNIGHSYAECRKRMNFQANSNNLSNPFQKTSNSFPRIPAPGRLNTIRDVPTCRYCKNPGHVIDQCRKRQYNNSKRANTGPNTQVQTSNSANNYSNKNSATQRNKSGNSNAPNVQGTTLRVQDL